MDYFKKEKSFAQAQQNFINAKQKPNQTVEEFTKSFNVEAQKYLAMSGHASKAGAKDLLETIKLSKYIEALRPDIAFELIKEAPETFDEAVRIAKNMEIALNSKSASEINNLTSKSENTLYEALIQLSKDQKSQIQELKEQVNNLKINENNASKNQTDTASKIERYCHICSKQNHDTQNCFFNKKASNNVYQPRGYQNNVRPRFMRHNHYQPNYSNRNFWRTPQQHTPIFHASHFQNSQRPYYNMTFQNGNMQNAISQAGINYQSPQVMHNQMAHYSQDFQNNIPAQNLSYSQGVNNQINYAGLQQNTQQPQNNYSQFNNGSNGQQQQPSITFPNENNQNSNRNSNRRRRGQNHLNL